MGDLVKLAPLKTKEVPLGYFPDMEKNGGLTLTLRGAVEYSQENYPQILKSIYQVDAARKSVSLQKVKEYNPDALVSYQQVAATHNKLTQILFGSPVLPPNPGPGLDTVQFGPLFFSGAGFLFDWAPIDFGLHKARITQAKTELNQAEKNLAVTRLDVGTQAAASYLEALVTREQVDAFAANVQRFSQFSLMVHALVDAGLRPGADASLADAQLANAQNDLIRAKLSNELAEAQLARNVGLGGRKLILDPGALVKISEPADDQNRAPEFIQHPMAQAAQSSVLTIASQKHVLDRTYYPKFRWLAGMNFRGSGLSVKGKAQSANASGFAPAVPNWNVGLVVDFPFMDILRIQAEKKVVMSRLRAEQESYNQILQDLRMQDVQARAKLRAAVALAANMPVQVEAALAASRQAESRYQAGLATVAQVATANQVLAESRVKDAVARIGVWQALLSIAYVQGDLRPFVDETARYSDRGGKP